MKKLMIALMMLMLLLPALAAADGPVLLVEMPEEAQMVENIQFEDGDFIQTYQISGAQVQLLRYASLGMSLEQMASSDFPGARDVTPLALERVGSFPAGGLTLVYEEKGQETLDVTLVLVDAGAYSLVFSAVVPQSADDTVRSQVEAMVQSLEMLSPDSNAEVG